MIGASKIHPYLVAVLLLIAFFECKDRHFRRLPEDGDREEPY
jgi:hypothetical protein